MSGPIRGPAAEAYFERKVQVPSYQTSVFIAHHKGPPAEQGGAFHDRFVNINVSVNGRIGFFSIFIQTLPALHHKL